MKRAIAVALFFIAIGMILMLLLPNKFLGVLLIILFLLLSYNCYCAGRKK